MKRCDQNPNIYPTNPLDYNYRVPKTIFCIPIAALLISGCSLNLSLASPVTPTPFIITATLPPSPLPPPTETLAPPTPIPTSPPHEGTTTSQVNVRGEPSTASAPLGMIGPNSKVLVIGKDPSGNWFQIIFAEAPDGKGWLTAQYVDVKDLDTVPVAGAAGSGPSGAIIQQVNVRSGPGTDFNTLGILNPKDVVALTGKDPNGVWLQIQYASGPEGKGWVTAAYVQAAGLDALPIVGGMGEVVGTGTPTGIPPTLTPTLIAAPQDNDSAASPAVRVTFSPSGTRSLIYSSDVSTPEGDLEDWIQFTPYSPSVAVSLRCLGNSVLNVELLQSNKPVQNWGSLACGETKQLDLSSGVSYLLRLFAVSQTSELVSVHYIISIETIQ
jgi:uncharacterized protein YraI